MQAAPPPPCVPPRLYRRYYYAVVVTDAVSTALTLYNECDGMEFEHSACKFDLRFVPDEQSFEGRQVRDAARDVPAGYEPPQMFNQSLQHTEPKLTWDADDEERKRKLQVRWGRPGSIARTARRTPLWQGSKEWRGSRQGGGGGARGGGGGARGRRM